jgi:hypothetical protein
MYGLDHLLAWRVRGDNRAVRLSTDTAAVVHVANMPFDVRTLAREFWAIYRFPRLAAVRRPQFGYRLPVPKLEQEHPFSAGLCRIGLCYSTST